MYKYCPHCGKELPQDVSDKETTTLKPMLKKVGISTRTQTVQGDDYDYQDLSGGQLESILAEYGHDE